jgi:RNA polymerase sigma-70 factor, ECF subfamily
VRSEARPLISLVKQPAAENAAPAAERPAPPARVPGRLERALTLHLDLIWRVLRRAGLTQADAEDAAQDVFWVFARRLAEVPEASERAFLVSTALRVAADRRRAKWYSVGLALDADARMADAPWPDEALDLRRAHTLLDSALDDLSSAERAVFVLSELEEMTRPEVARSLEISEGTVASRLARARTRFHAALKRLCARPRRRG